MQTMQCADNGIGKKCHRFNRAITYAFNTAFKRISEKLEQQGLIKSENSYVWLANP